MILDDIRARYPAIGIAVFAMEPGQPVTIETYSGEQVFAFVGDTVDAALAKAFPEMMLAEPAPEPGLSREATMRVVSSLAAAISLLERSPKKAAPSNKMFDQMLVDYRAALDAARAELNPDPAETEASAPAANVFD